MKFKKQGKFEVIPVHSYFLKWPLSKDQETQEFMKFKKQGKFEVIPVHSYFLKWPLSKDQETQEFMKFKKQGKFEVIPVHSYFLKWPLSKDQETQSFNPKNPQLSPWQPIFVSCQWWACHPVFSLMVVPIAATRRRAWY